MELTADQQRQIKSIMKEMNCPRNFRCYKSKFKNLTPVEAFPGDSIVECLKTEDLFYLMCFTVGKEKAFCMCPLRRYIALEFSR